MKQIKKVKIKGSDLDVLYETFDNMERRADYYTPTIDELKQMIMNLKKYALFLMWINETGEINEENEEQHAIIEQIIKQYIVIDYAS